METLGEGNTPHRNTPMDLPVVLNPEKCFQSRDMGTF
jgi:hypothetical protein